MYTHNSEACNSEKKNNTVLIVEDEALIAADLEMLLEDNGYEVVSWATNIAEAVRAAEFSRPAIAIVDIQLRGGDDGIALAEDLHRRYATDIIFVTAQADPSTVARARQVPHRAYINKPYSEKILLEALEYVDTSDR